MNGWVNRLRLKLRALFRKNHDHDIREELTIHLAFLEEEFRAAGMPADEARAAARRQFGNATRVEERSRELFSFRLVEDLLRDASTALRSIWKAPGFALIVIAALTIGVGANVTVFGFVNALLLRPLDAADPARLVRVYSERTDPRAFIDYRDYLQYRNRNRSFSSLAMSQWGGLFQVQARQVPAQMIHVMPVTGNYFEALGIGAALGRTIAEGDDQPAAANVVVLSDACWRRYYGADPEIVGQIALLNRVPFTVIGVLPESFTGTDGSTLIPMHYIPWIDSSSSGYLIGRLKPGVSSAEAQTDLSRIAEQLTLEKGRRSAVVVYPAAATSPLLKGQFSLFALLFMLVVGIVLLIACDNIAILLLTRWSARRREIAIRLALGAGRFRLIRQLLAENLLLAGAGGVFAMGVAIATGRLLQRFTFPVPMPHGLRFAWDWRVVVFAIGLTFATTLLFGLGPALQFVKTDVVTSIKEGGISEGGRFKTRSRLVALQIAMCTTLLVATAGLLRSLDTPALNAGFAARGILMATIDLPAADYTPETSIAFCEAMLKRFEGMDGIASAAVVKDIPLMPNAPLGTVDAVRDGGVGLPVFVNSVSRAYFRTLGIPLTGGRDFTEHDDAESKAVGIVNETLARRLWPTEDATGKGLRVAGGLIEIIGVARDIKYESLDEEPKSFLYRPLAQQPVPTVTLLIKTKHDPIAALPFVRSQLAAADPGVLADNWTTLEERIGLNLLPNRAAALLGGALGLLALGLSMMGTYGAMALTARQRTREIGIRVALGAGPASVVRLVTRQGLAAIAIGVLFGWAGGLAATTLLRRFLYGVPLLDPATFIALTVLVGSTAYLSCYIPARRATRVDPAAVLHDS